MMQHRGRRRKRLQTVPNEILRGVELAVSGWRLAGESPEFADQMISDYPESYAGYKRKAFVLLYIEAGKAENMRNYAEFKVNYEKAEELYSKEKNQSDPEMETLRKEHDDLVKGGRIT